MPSGPSGRLVVLGATGSIGQSALDVAARFPDRFQVVGLAAGRNIDLLADQTRRFHPLVVSVAEARDRDRLIERLGPDVPAEVLWGRDGLIQLAGLAEADIVVSAVVGAAGLEPTWTAVRAGKRIALANKESLVVAGELVMAEAGKTGARLLPVDSEHSAIFQSLAGQRKEDVKRLILTASGGPFRGHDPARLAAVSPQEALNHPNWSMGAKITIDSATLMNKGLETIEARWLFDLPFNAIDIQIHPQSIVHSMVEFVDGSVIAQMGRPDMRVPIAYALSFPMRLPLGLEPLDLPGVGALTFFEPDRDRFPCLDLAIEAGRMGGSRPAAMNAANEVAVAAFLEGRLPFPGIAHVVRSVLEKDDGRTLSSIEDVLAADQDARRTAEVLVDRYSAR